MSLQLQIPGILSSGEKNPPTGAQARLAGYHLRFFTELFHVTTGALGHDANKWVPFLLQPLCELEEMGQEVPATPNSYLPAWSDGCWECLQNDYPPKMT